MLMELQQKRRLLSTHEEQFIPEELIMEILSRLPVNSMLQFKLVSKLFKSLINNLELIINILSRLPVKSLMRFKLVSKSFNSLISKDNHFAKLHLRCSAPNANPQVIFWHPHDADADAYVSYLHVKSLLKTPPAITNELVTLMSFWKHPYKPIGSCNGLVCLIGIHDEQTIWISYWNPATRSTSHEWFILPLALDSSYLHVCSDVGYCCDAGYWYLPVYSGFGYDHVSDTYKVLFLQPNNQDVLVFNMGDTNWRHVASFPPDLSTPEKGDLIGVHFNGTLNWLAILKIYEDHYNHHGHYFHIQWDNSSSVILSFDLNKEEFVSFLLPAMPSHFNNPHLGVLGECLCVSLCSSDNIMIWQMKEFGVDRSWTKLLKVSVTFLLLNLSPDALPDYFPLYMFDNGDVLPLELQEYLINVRDNELSLLQFPDKLEFMLPHAMICCESLISPC